MTLRVDDAGEVVSWDLREATYADDRVSQTAAIYGQDRGQDLNGSPEPETTGPVVAPPALEFPGAGARSTVSRTTRRACRHRRSRPSHLSDLAVCERSRVGARGHRVGGGVRFHGGLSIRAHHGLPGWYRRVGGRAAGSLHHDRRGRPGSSARQRQPRPRPEYGALRDPARRLRRSGRLHPRNLLLRSPGAGQRGQASSA